MANSNLVIMEWLKDHLEDSQIVIVDCRFVLGKPTEGEASYKVDHLPGAVHFDLEKDLAGAKAAHGGRHPMPDMDELAKKLGEAGIDQQKTVVAYDDQGGAMASRFWWILQYLGHEHTKVLNGGYSLWKEKGYPVTSEIPEQTPVAFIPQVQKDWLVDIEYVKQMKDLDDVVLIDSREGKRYKGIEEHADPVAGHIPGALNFFWKEILNPQGTVKSSQELKEWFGPVDSNKEVVVYCGSGVTACPNILALKEAGYEKVKLYAGSWSDWCSYSENPVATEEE